MNIYFSIFVQKVAPFEKFQYSLQEEAGGGEYETRSTKGFLKPCSSNQSVSKQHTCTNSIAEQL